MMSGHTNRDMLTWKPLVATVTGITQDRQKSFDHNCTMLPQLKLENCPCAHVCRSLLLPHVGGLLIKSPQSFLTSLLRFLHYRLCVAHRLSQGLLRHGRGLLCKAAECRRVQQRLLGELGYLSAQHRSKYLWWTGRSTQGFGTLGLNKRTIGHTWLVNPFLARSILKGTGNPNMHRTQGDRM